MSGTLRIDAPAKLNLGLSILSRRSDGYHDLLSVFQTISWSDTITIGPAEAGTELTCNDPHLPTGPENLVWRAAETVRGTFGRTDGVRIRLEKRIPVGAGLGGGSSDAAATMRGLEWLWGIRAEEDEWGRLCASLGSDVPFFRYGGTAVVEGRGERVTPLPRQERLDFLVVVPTFEVSTRWAYRQLSPPFADARDFRSRVDALRSGGLSLRQFCRDLHNDFEAVVEPQYPVIAEIRSRLMESGAMMARMSGSGSAVFGVFETASDAQHARDAIPPDMQAAVAHTVP